jgi:beta-glucosidase-like glycosyl hydrolase
LARDAKRILVAGTHADDIGYQCGGWTIAWHGDSGKITLGKQGLCFAKNKYFVFISSLYSYQSIV